MFIGSHLLLYSKNPEADRVFFREVLGFRSVDAGEGWLIFAMPPAEAGIHPLENSSAPHPDGHALLGCELYLMCADLDRTIASLESKSVQCTPVRTAPWGSVTSIQLPSGGYIGLYQPRHPTAFNVT